MSIHQNCPLFGIISISREDDGWEFKSRSGGLYPKGALLDSSPKGEELLLEELGHLENLMAEFGVGGDRGDGNGGSETCELISLEIFLDNGTSIGGHKRAMKESAIKSTLRQN